MRAPDLFGSATIPTGRVDTRWASVRAAKAPLWLGPELCGLSLEEQARAVDRFVNERIEYRPDAIDRWATPAETIARGHGDCEDLALLKRALLLQAGVPEDRVFFCIVNVPSMGPHAVLAVDVGDRFLILDSFNSLTLPDLQVAEYRPIVTYSGDRAWVHGSRV